MIAVTLLVAVVVAGGAAAAAAAAVRPGECRSVLDGWCALVSISLPNPLP